MTPSIGRSSRINSPVSVLEGSLAQRAAKSRMVARALWIEATQGRSKVQGCQCVILRMIHSASGPEPISKQRAASKGSPRATAAGSMR